MITGFNTDIEHDGVVYHVQTEDKGLETPLILSLVYSGGAILASKRARYEDLIASGFSDEALSERLTRQHKLICAAIHAGRLEDLKRMSGARVEVAAPALPQTPELKPVSELELEPELEPETELVPEPDLEILRGDEEREALEAHQVAYNLEKEQLASQEAAAKTEASFDEIGDLTIEEKLPPPSQFVTSPLDENPLYSVHDQRRQSVMGDLSQAKEGLRITLLGRHEFRSGHTLNVKVLVGWRSGNQEKPVPKAAVSVKVLGTAFRPQLYSAKTHSDGVAAIATRIPSFTSGRAAILIRAVFDGNETELRRVIHPG
ncbi:MAG: hypothetical protein M3447_10365 [Acidobacteriota bacterium]|nr:hypothetical protein [Acidobacteriota bacterium]